MRGRSDRVRGRGTTGSTDSGGRGERTDTDWLPNPLILWCCEDANIKARGLSSGQGKGTLRTHLGLPSEWFSVVKAALGTGC
jgi:hypothetical protein